MRRLHLFADESAAVAGDIEPGFDVVAPPQASVAMVSGAVAAAGKPYFDLGTAPCHGRDCTHGWTPKQICAIVNGGGRYAIPEVYFGPPLNQADEWATIQAECGVNAFAGVSGRRSARSRSARRDPRRREILCERCRRRRGVVRRSTQDRPLALDCARTAG